MHKRLKVIAFDADDTLWVNEPYFQETEHRFYELLSDYLTPKEAGRELFTTQVRNLPLYGYGIKCFVLCMIETTGRVTNGTASVKIINEIISLGQELLAKPVELLEGVEDLLGNLKGRYQLVVATKGDLLDQQRKLEKSGLQEHFHHIEIMSNKMPGDYQKLLKHLNCLPENFLMLGNSIKSDVLPVLELQGYAAHIPFHTTWLHEQHNSVPDHSNFLQLSTIIEILDHLH